MSTVVSVAAAVSSDDQAGPEHHREDENDARNDDDQRCEFVNPVPSAPLIPPCRPVGRGLASSFNCFSHSFQHAPMCERCWRCDL